jgi:hypothetical protein
VSGCKRVHVNGGLNPPSGMLPTEPRSQPSITNGELVDLYAYIFIYHTYQDRYTKTCSFASSSVMSLQVTLPIDYTLGLVLLCRNPSQTQFYKAIVDR